jgi:FdhE protein
MSENEHLSSEQIQKAVAEVRKLKPNYARMLDFYEKIFMAQKASENQTRIEPVKISASTLDLKVKEKFPLIDISQFAIDDKSAETLFRNLCDILQNATGEMPESARAITEAVDGNKLDLNVLFAAFLKSDDSFFQKVADELKIDIKTLGFITYNSVKPSLVLCAQQLSTHLDKNRPWEKGYCPVCGSPPILSMFGSNGQRFFCCSFCWHKWPTQRIYCPFCDNTDHDTLHYFDIENEEEHRVDVCDKCGKYIKTVDTRKAERVIYPPLEHLSTPHLDIKATEMGHKSGIAIGF